MKQKIYYYLFFLGLSFFSSYGFAQPSSIVIEVPFYLNGTYIGDVELCVGQNKEYLVSSSVLPMLHPCLNPNGLDIITHLLQDNPYLVVPYSSDNIVFDYDNQDQIIFLTLDFKYLQTNKTSLRKSLSNLQIPEDSYLNPAPISGIIDLSLDSRLYQFDYKDPPSFTNMNLGAKFSLNLKDTLIDGYGYLINYTGGSVKQIAHTLNRNNVTITRDFIHSNCRVKLGDISPPSISFQSNLPMLGISLLNSQNMFRNNTSYSTVGQHEFMLNAPSKVDVYLNQTFLRTLNLPAGPQLIKDFPFANGVNDVTLKITDPMGNTNELHLEKLYVPLKLLPGEFNFDVALGVPRFQETSQKFKYLFNDFMFSGILGTGISSQMTYQAYFQALTQNNVYCGSSLLYYNKFMQTHLEVGASFTKAIPAGVRARIGLFSANFDRSSLFSWQCNLDFTSRSFSYLSTESFINKEKLLFSGSINTKMPAKISASLTGYYGLNRMQFPKVWSLEYTMSKGFKHGSGSIVASYKQLDIGKKVFEMVFNLSLSPIPSTTINSNYNSRSKTSNTFTSYRKQLNNQETLSFSAGLATAKNTKNFAGGMNYQGNRGSAFIDHYLVESALLPLSESSKVSGTTQINGRSAIFFANNTLCIGTPSRSSFTIIKPVGLAKKYPLYVNSSSAESFDIKSSLPMGCVFTLPNYGKTSFQIDSYEKPIGYQFKTQLYHIKTKNQSGAVALVELQAFMTATGYFINQNNEPISYSSGYLTKLDVKNSKKIFFYTNGYGKFYLDGLEEGAYSLHFDQFNSKPHTINIKESVELIKLNKIKIDLTIN